jgi:hypothetical protein
VVPPPAGLSHNRRRTLPGNAFHERVGSSRAHSRNYHNEESTAGVRIERTFSLPITRYRTILASGIEPDSVPCSSMLSSLCPGLFPGVTPFRRAGGAHVVPETLGLHIPVVLRAHGSRNSQAANAACAIQRLRILPFTTGSALLQLQTSPHDRWKMECAFMLCACFTHIRRGGSWLFPNNKDSGNLDIPNNERSFYAVQ